MLTTQEQKDLLQYVIRLQNADIPVPLNEATAYLSRLLHRAYPLSPRLVKIRLNGQSRYAWRCPMCSEILGDVTDKPEVPDRHIKYCQECGQRIDEEEAFAAYSKARGIRDMYAEEIGEILREAEEETRGNMDE